MKTKIFFIGALALGHACFAQTPAPTAGSSSWQLAPPFETSLSSPTPSNSTPTKPVARSTPTQSAPTAPAQAIRSLKSSSKMPDADEPVWVMTFVKTKSGSSDEYLKSITGLLKPIFDEEKKQKIILDYKILSGDAAGDRDFNVIIMAQYPNSAALNGLRERTEPIIDLIIGPADKRRDLAAKRLDIREILATKTMREITLK
jgi:hypothetical protein